MRVFFDKSKSLIITCQQNFHFYLTKDPDKTLKHETDSIVRHNEDFA